MVRPRVLLVSFPEDHIIVGKRYYLREQQCSVETFWYEQYQAQLTATQVYVH